MTTKYSVRDSIIRYGKKVGEITKVDSSSFVYFKIEGYDYSSYDYDIEKMLYNCKIMNIDEYTMWYKGFVRIKGTTNENLVVYLKVSEISAIESWGEDKYTIYVGDRGYSTILTGGLEDLGLVWMGEKK